MFFYNGRKAVGKRNILINLLIFENWNIKLRNLLFLVIVKRNPQMISNLEI